VESILAGHSVVWLGFECVRPDVPSWALRLEFQPNVPLFGAGLLAGADRVDRLGTRPAKLYPPPNIYTRALSITQGRAVGMAHYLLGRNRDHLGILSGSGGRYLA
jgi:hypothetical protein